MKKLWILLVAVTLALTAGAFAQTGKDKDKKDSSAFDKGAEQAAGKIDINSASKDELMTLNGVGEETAEKIIAARPYQAKNELVKKKIVSQRIYKNIKEHIIAHRTEAATEK
jgi:competence protein ComEA